MIYSPEPPHRLISHWMDRHPGRASFVLHMIGIPPTILGVLLLSLYIGFWSWSTFLLAILLFLGGYLLQFAGHGLERTDPGEIIFLKRKLGLPYVEFPASRQSRV